MRLIATIIVTLVLATTSIAAEWVQRGSHFFKNGIGQPHVRSVVTAGGWYQNGCYRSYSYPVYDYTPLVEAEDFWEILAKGVANKQEKELRVKALEALGYVAPSSYQRLDIYGQVPVAFNPKYAEPLDVNAAIQSYMLAVKASSVASSEALVGAQSIMATAAEESSRQQKFILTVKALEALYQRPLATVVQEVRPQVQVLGGRHPAVLKDGSCLSCHSGPEAKGKFDMSDWLSLSAEDKVRIAGAIATGAMPPPEAVKAGKAKAVDKARAREVFE